MKIHTWIHYIIFSTIVLTIPTLVSAQYKWVPYSGNPEFMSLEDDIDKGRILYHKLAQNNSSIAANRGLLFNATLFAFPSLNGSFAWSQVRVNIGKISFYPHIYTFDRKTSSFAIAILYNISRVSPVRGVRTRPSFSPSSLLQLEKEKMNFIKLKFVSEGFETEIILQPNNQETELSLSDYDVNYSYWIKSSPTQKEIAELRTFFARPLKSFKIRAYSDKGYLDTTLDGGRVAQLSTIFTSSIDLYQTLIDPNYVNRVANTNKAPTNTNQTPPVTNTNRRTAAPAQKAPAQQQQRKAPAQPRRAVATNTRPVTSRVVKPK